MVYLNYKLVQQEKIIMDEQDLSKSYHDSVLNMSMTKGRVNSITSMASTGEYDCESVDYSDLLVDSD